MENEGGELIVRELERHMSGLIQDKKVESILTLCDEVESVTQRQRNLMWNEVFRRDKSDR